MKRANSGRAQGLVQIIGAFEKHGTVYCLMEFIDGQSLDNHLAYFFQRRPHVPPDAVLELARAMLEALAMVHREEVLHRDVKPSNIMIRRDGQPVLIDFGAARPMGRTSELASMYSRRYAALEQFPAQRTGHSNALGDGPWTDIFALSVVLYELVSQSLPTNAKGRWDALRKAGQDPYVPVRDNILRNRIIASYPGPLLDAIDIGCKLFAEDRPRSVEEMSRHFEGLIEPIDPAPGPSRETVSWSRTPEHSSPKPSPATEKRPSPKHRSQSPHQGLQFILALIFALAAGGVLYGYLTQ